MTPERVAAIILGEVVSKAKPVLEDMGGTLGRALVTIPAYFSNIQLKCMKHVLGMVGTSGLKSYARGFAREPSAAAYAYMYDVTDPHLLRWILVFDFGGGTVDVSVVSQELENRLEVKGQFGNLVTGGEDLDDIIVALVSLSSCLAAQQFNSYTG